MQDDSTGIYTSCCVLGHGKRGALRMGAHVMTGSLLLCCLLALVIPAKSLKCHTCVGNDNECSPTEVTCPGEKDVCATTALHVDSFPCKVQKVFKGCINSTANSTKLLISPSQLVTLSLQQETCNSDLCNAQKISDPDPDENDLFCHSCISPKTSCDSDKMKEMRCMGEHNLCLDMKVKGSFGDIADVNIKGCGRIPLCKENLAFSSQNSSVTVKCCKENFCNSDIDSEPEGKTPNGIQCYSCNTLDGARCSPEEVVKAQCYGDLTFCLEVEGTSMKDGRITPTVIKGCATPSMCNSLVLPLLQKLGTATVKCCNGSLCNNQFSESRLQASGYLPIGNASPGTGIQNTPSSDATKGGTSRRRKRSGSPVKTGHHANIKYGAGSMPTSSSTYHNDDGSSEFNGPNMSPGNSNAEGIKGGSWHSNSNSGYPNTPFHSYHCIFAESESSIVPNSINYSSGEKNHSALSPGGSAVGANSSNSNVSSIPNVPPTFPDFNSYGDSSIVPNNDNNVNNSNNNDFNSYESVGFTEIVYVDIDLNDGQSGSPTVAPGGIDSNSYDSYNQNIILSANSNGSSDYSADTVNTKVQKNNAGTHILTSTTPKTYNSDINQQISGNATNIYNTGMANNNGSGNYISSSGHNPTGSGNDSSVGTAGILTPRENHTVSSPVNSSSGQNNLNMLSPGGPGFGGEVPPNSTNYSNSDVSSMADVPPTFPDFDSYGDSSIVPNPYYDNDMNNQDNNDLSSYESIGFTEIVYVDIVLKIGQPGSPTVAPGSIVSNSYDSVGNSETDNNAYNPNIILSANNNGSVQHLAPETSKTPNSGIKQHISGHGSNIYNTGIANNNGSGNYISSSGNNPAGSGNNSSAGTYGSSSFGGSTTVPGGNESSTTYTSSGNGTGMANEWNNSNYSSNHNMAVPLGYANSPGSNYSSPSHSGSGNGTGMTSQWIHSNDSNHNMAAPVGNNNIPGHNHSSTSYTGNGTGMSNEWSYSNSSSPSMAVPGGYANIHGNNATTTYTSSGNGTGMTHGCSNGSSSNHSMSVPGGYAKVPGSNNSLTSYASSGNGTGMTHGCSNSSSSNHSMSVPGGYANVPGSNNSSTSYVGSGNGTGMTHGCSNSSSCNHSMSVPGGYANVPGSNNSSTSYVGSGNGTGMTHGWSNGSSSNHSMSVPGGYANVPGSNNSSTSYVGSGNGTGMTHGWSNGSSSNHSMSVPGGYANVPGSNNSSTSYASPGNGTGLTNEWINGSSSSHNMASPGGSYGSFNSNGSNAFPNSNHSSHPMIPYGSTYGNGSSFDSIESYLNHMFSGANNNGSHSNTSSWPNQLIPGGSNHSNETAWIYGSSYNPNMLPNSNGSFSNYNGIQDFLSKLNGSTHGNGSINVSEWIQNHGYFSNLLPPGMNHNGSGPYTINGSLADYMNSLGLGNIPNITSVFSGGNNGSFNISNFGSGWGNIMYNPNLMNPNAPHNGSTYSSGPIPSNNESSYSNIHNPNLSGSPNSNGQPNNTNGMSSGGYNNGSVNGNGHNSYLMPHGGNNTGAFFHNGSNMGHESVNSSSYNSNMMIPGVGSGYNMSHGLNGSILGNGSNTGGPWSNGYNPDELVPGRSTNDSTTGNDTVGGNGTMPNGASSLWTKSGSFVIFSAIALLVLS